MVVVFGCPQTLIVIPLTLIGLAESAGRMTISTFPISRPSGILTDTMLVGWSSSTWI